MTAAVLDCRPQVDDELRQVEKIEEIRKRAFTRDQTQAAISAAHVVECHWNELSNDARIKVRAFVDSFDEWAKTYRPRGLREVLRACSGILSGDNWRFSIAVGRLITIARQKIREDAVRGRTLADYLSPQDAEVARQLKLSEEQFNSGEFVTLTSEQIRRRNW